jgi:RNA polymerase sigma factor (sigma-70 family)
MTGRLLQTVIRRAESLAAEVGPDTVPDTVLLARYCASRDESAFAALVDRHGPVVWAVCRHLLLDPADAEDAFQATFLALVRSARSLPATSMVGGWLHGVAVRSAAQIRRTAARRRRREERAARPEAGQPVPDAAWDSLINALHEEVHLLPEALRTAFVLCDLEGVRQPDAAARLGWKLGTLSGRLTKARQRLLDRLAKRGIAPGLASGVLVIGAAATGASAPAGLVVRTVGLSVAAADAVPPALWKLALEVTPMTVNRTKLIAACVLLAGGLAAGLGTAIMGSADAQGPPTGGYPGDPSAASIAQPGGSPYGSGGRSGGSGMPSPDGSGSMMPGYPSGLGTANTSRTRWEYEFAAKPRSLQEFRNLLRRFGEQGWEYAGVESFEEPRQVPMGPSGAAPMPPGGTTSTMVVFKRPLGAVITTSGAGGPRYGSGAMSPPAGTGETDLFGPRTPGMSAPGSSGSGRGMSSGVPSMPQEGGGPDAGGFKVIALRHASALDLAATLKQLYGTVQIVGDARSNSIILKGDSAAARELEELIRKLDVPGADETGGAGGLGGTPPRPGSRER